MPAAMPIVVVDGEVLVQGLDGAFPKSVCWRIIGGSEAQVDGELAVEVSEELGSKWRPTVKSDRAR